MTDRTRGPRARRRPPSVLSARELADEVQVDEDATEAGEVSPPLSSPPGQRRLPGVRRRVRRSVGSSVDRPSDGERLAQGARGDEASPRGSIPPAMAPMPPLTGAGLHIPTPVPSPVPGGDLPYEELFASPLSSDVLQPEMYLAPELQDASEVTSPRLPGLSFQALGGHTGDVVVQDADGQVIAPPSVALGETLQLVHYARRGDTLLITGITPHGRRLTFEQREDRQGWYVVAAGRRRRPTDRELGLVIATITQEMEAALVPERQAEVRSAYRLAVTSDQPGLRVGGLEAYRDVLLDESAAYIAGIVDRLAVISIDYQAFKRFAIRHGHRVGASFVQALGERLADLYASDDSVQVFHKSGKSFRLIVIDRSAEEIQTLINGFTTDETRQWIVERVWGTQKRTHPDEVHFHIGIAKASRADRDSEYSDLAQRLSDDAHRASKLGQLKGHTSIALAKTAERTTIEWWTVESEDDLQELAASMDDGPADVMAEMSDYLHELIPADLEGMAVAGDLDALLHRAIARAGFWQGTTAMRIAGDRLLERVLDPAAEKAPDDLDFVAGFDLGDEFYGIVLEDDILYFARGDVNSAGATRVRAGLSAVQRVVGWEREDGGGIVGNFIRAIEDRAGGLPLVERVRRAAQASYEEAADDPALHVNDAVDVADYLHTADGRLASPEDLVEDALLVLALPGLERKPVKVLERRSGFTLRLEIEGEEQPAVFDDTHGLQVKLRIRNTVASAAICVLKVPTEELRALLAEIREENHVAEDQPLDVLGFLRHVADILLEDVIKAPAKVDLALGGSYEARRFVRAFRLEHVREGYPGLYYEAVHMDLLAEQPAPDIDRHLVELVGATMLSSPRPRR